MTMRNTSLLALAVAVALGCAGAGAQSPGVNRVMREKLDRAQKVLEAVVTSNWACLETETRELQRLTDDPRWQVLKYPEYARFSADFRRTLDDLHAAAAQRDLEKAPKAYVAVTMSCVDCHRYMARSRIVDIGRR